MPNKKQPRSMKLKRAVAKVQALVLERKKCYIPKDLKETSAEECTDPASKEILNDAKGWGFSLLKT